MKNNELLAIRNQILADVVPLVTESADNGADRFSLLLRIIQAGNAGADVYKRAYESAKQIEDNDERLEAFMALLDEIDFDTTSPPEETAEEVEPQSEDTNKQPTENYETHVPVVNQQ